MKHMIILLALSGALSAHAESNLGRLFLTPQKRDILDALRQNNAHLNPEETLDKVRLDGIVRRSSGKQTIWINGRPYSDHAPVSRSDERSARVITGSRKGVELKVGESTKLAPDSKQPTP